MKWSILALIAVIGCVAALPVTPKKKETEEHKAKTEEGDGDFGSNLEYERYLKEIVDALESDTEFRKKLDQAPEADIRNGKIAQELEYVSHNVRSKLDEIKRREIVRLRELANKQYELSNDIDREHLKVPTHHLDHTNEHTFEIDDLKKLIKKTSEDLAEADKKRREEFKQYELQKEFEKNAVEQEMDEEAKKKYEHELQEQKEKHNKHEKLHHPGNKAQLEEVWEKQDHMDKDDFDPRSFFMMHDIDSNGFWDETEVKALFVKELDKVYQSGLPEDDMRERAEEMERMREHVFSETDINRDGLISFQEFLDQTKREEYQKDPGWDTVDNTPQFTHEEYMEYERKRQDEIQRLVAQGMLPPHPNMPHGYYPNGQPHPGQNLPPPHYQQQPQFQQQYHPQAQAPVPVNLHPNQVYQNVPANGHPQQGGNIHYQQVPQMNQVPQAQNQQYQAQPQQYQQQQQQYQGPPQQQYNGQPQQQQQYQAQPQQQNNPQQQNQAHPQQQNQGHPQQVQPQQQPQVQNVQQQAQPQIQPVQGQQQQHPQGQIQQPAVAQNVQAPQQQQPAAQAIPAVNH